MTDPHTLFREADAIAAPDLWAEIEVRAAERAVWPMPSWSVPGPRKRISAAVVAVAATAIAIAVIVWTFRPDEANRPAAPVDWRIADRVDVGGSPSSIVTAGGALWVSTTDGLVRVDPVTEAVTRPIALMGVGPLMGAGQLAAEADGTIWADTGQGVVRIDPATGAVSEPTRLHNAADAALGAGFGSAWVGEYKGTSIRRLDPSGGVVPIEDTGWPTQIVATDDAIWSISLDGVVQRIDPATDRIVLTVDLGAALGQVGMGAFGLVAEGPSLWATVCLGATGDEFGVPRGCSWSVVHIDASTGGVLGSVDLGTSTETPTEDGLDISLDGVRTVFARDGELWIAMNDYEFHGTGNPYVGDQGERAEVRNSRILRVDGTTGAIMQTIPADDSAIIDAATTPGAVWLVDIGAGQLIRLEPTDRQP